MPIELTAVAIDNTIVRSILTAQRYHFVDKRYIPITLPRISPVSHNNRIAVVGIIDCGLNVVEICRPIVINSDYFRLTGNG
jgi:hypothetical protein